MTDKKIQKIIDICYKLIDKGNSLEQCIELFKDYEQQIRDYFETVKDLRSLRTIGPSEGFRQNSLESILARAGSTGKLPSLQEGSKKIHRKRIIIRPALVFLIVFIISVFSFTGTLFASQESLPGETFYPLKRSFENFRLNIYPDNLKDELYLEFLNNRIFETERLLDEDVGISLIEGSILEVENHYQRCKQYGCITPENEDAILDSINSVKNRYQNSYGTNDKGSDRLKNENHGQSQGSNRRNYTKK